MPRNVKIYTQKVTNDRIRFNWPSPANWNLLAISVQLVSGAAIVGGTGIIDELGLPYSSSGYIDLIAGQPLTIESNQNIPFGGIDIDASGDPANVVQIVITYIDDL